MGREVKRVAIDFDWPLTKVWDGYINPHYTAEQCEHCNGKGYSPEARKIYEQWYSHGEEQFDPRSTGSKPYGWDDPTILEMAKRNCHQVDVHDPFVITEAIRLSKLFNNAWSHHLSQDDVDALVAAGRLVDFTHTWDGTDWKPKDPPYHPTAEEVNRWSLNFMGHDAINCWVCVAARCKREGVPLSCDHCNGNGAIWPSEEARKLYDDWEQEEPPPGDGYQLWETVSEGSPISPVFDTPEALAQWLVENDNSIHRNTTRDQWIEFIRGPGWAPTMILETGVEVDEIAWMGDKRQEETDD